MTTPTAAEEASVDGAAGPPADAPARSDFDAQPELTRNPDWYRALYNLAVLRANQSFKCVADNDHGKGAELRELAEIDARGLVYYALRETRLLHNRRTRKARDLRRFLERNLLPSSLVLLAGIWLSQDRTSDPEAPVVGRRRIAAEVQRTDGGGLDPMSLANFASELPLIAGSVHYNLACFYSILSTKWDDPEAIRNEAIEQLRLFTWWAEPAEAQTQLTWATDDPTLAPIATMSAFKAIIAAFSTAAVNSTAKPAKVPSKRRKPKAKPRRLWRRR